MCNVCPEGEYQLLCPLYDDIRKALILYANMIDLPSIA